MTAMRYDVDRWRLLVKERASYHFVVVGLNEAAQEVERLRELLFDLTWKVMSETEAGRFGRPGYDMTLDDLYDTAEHVRSQVSDDRVAS